MRKRVLAIAICSAASVVVAAAALFQPLNVKTGLWQMTEAINWTGLPPQLAAMMRSSSQTITYTSCVTTENLKSNPWASKSRDRCTWTVLSSTSTDMEVQGTECDLGKDYEMTAEIHGKIHAVDPENGTGSMLVTLTGNGQTMHGVASYTGKWVNASCSAR